MYVCFCFLTWTFLNKFHFNFVFSFTFLFVELNVIICEEPTGMNVVLRKEQTVKHYISFEYTFQKHSSSMQHFCVILYISVKQIQT